MLRAAARSAIVSRCVRGIDAPRPARDEPRRPARRAARRGPRGHGLPGRRLRRAGVRLRAAGGRRRRLPQRGDRRGLGAGQGHAATATCAGPPSATPAGTSQTNVGYSTPEHRAAIAAHGVSPLHRMSFQSIAYSAARASRPVRRTQNACLHVLEREERARGVEHHADRVEAELRRVRTAAARPASHSRAMRRTWRRLRRPIDASGLERPARSRAGDRRLDLAEDEVALDRPRPGPARRSGCGSCGRRARSRAPPGGRAARRSPAAPSARRASVMARLAS